MMTNAVSFVNVKKMYQGYLTVKEIIVNFIDLLLDIQLLNCYIPLKITFNFKLTFIFQFLFIFLIYSF